MCYDVFWGKAKSGHSHLQALGSGDGDDVGCADGAKAMIRGIIADGGGSNPWPRRQMNMLMPTLTGQAAADSERKWAMVSPWMAFF